MERGTLRKTLSMVILALFCVSAGCALPGTPRDSLSRLRTALLNHDADGALRYLDVDSITEHLAEDLLNRYDSSGDELTSLGVRAGRTLGPLLLPVVREAVRN